MSARVGARFVLLLSLFSRVSAQEGPPSPAEVRAQSLLLNRVDRWLGDARTLLVGHAANPQAVENAMADLKEEIKKSVREEVRGSRVVGNPRTGEERPARPAPAAAPLVASRFEGRFARKEELRKMGGGTGTEDALGKALEWLARHQSADGRWDGAGFADRCAGNKCDGPGMVLSDVGVTGLALLAFLGDGNFPGEGKHRLPVGRAGGWLLAQQKPDTGLIGESNGDLYLYCHAIATMALAEVYAFTSAPDLRTPLERAVGLILHARNPSKAWRYTLPPTGDNDTSVTSWMVLALKAAEDAGIRVEDRTAYEGALAWFDEMTDMSSGRCGYRQKGELSSRMTGTKERFPAEKTEALTAAALICRLHLGQTREKHPILRLHADLLRRTPPVWEVTPERSLVDEYYWYYGSLAMFQMGGEDWKAWNVAMKKALLEHQRHDGDERGSWDPLGAWGTGGGRIGMTAFCALCLEAYYRFPLIRG